MVVASGVFVACFLWLTSLHPDHPLVLVEKPGRSRPDASAAASEPIVARVSAVAPKEVADDSPVAEMAPVKVLAETIASSVKSVTFLATTAVDAGIAQEAAEDLVAVVQTYWKERRTGSSSRASLADHVSDYFFSVWPDLPGFVKNGQCSIEVAFIPADARYQRNTMSPVMDHGIEELRFIAMGQTWKTTFVFKNGPSVPNPPIYEKVWRVAKESMPK